MKLFDRIRRLARTQDRRRSIELALERFEDRILLSSFTVTNNSASLEEGSLPWAVEQVNGDSATGVDVIDFDLPGNELVIELASTLTLTHPVLIDGTSQSGYDPTNPMPLITIRASSGSGSGAIDGFVLASGSDGSTIQGLSIVKFVGAAIHVQSTDDTVQSDYLGVTPAGANGGNGVGVLLASGAGGLGNSGNGIYLLGSSVITISGVTPNPTASSISGNTIRSNIIAGNSTNGILVMGLGATANTIISNWIGLSPGGTRMANGADGVLLEDAGPGNVVGGVGQGNIISGNSQEGVAITGSPAATSGTLVCGNFIGTDPSGTSAIGNGADGVLVYGSSGSTIGGATGFPGTGLGNVIAGNSQAGILIDNPAGTQTSKNMVVGNLIGTNAAGSAELGNGSDGIQILNASGNIIGGASRVYRNVISGNVRNGLLIAQSPNLSASGNQVLGNFIGTNSTGTAALGNGSNGVELIDGSANVVGGISGGAPIPSTEVPSAAGPGGAPGNLISGNNQWGVLMQVTGASEGQPQSLIQGNTIGLNAAQTLAIGNGSGGILVNNVTTQPIGQTIGGSTAGAGNIITGNNNVGIQLFGPQVGGSGVNDVVQGNLIGLDAAGQFLNLSDGATGNGTGIWVYNSPHDLIGGTSPTDRNVISGNSQYGIELSGTFSTGDLVLGNLIGTNLAGNARPADSSGVVPSEAAPSQTLGVSISGASGDTVGEAGAGNVISGNAVGVQITGVGQSNGQFYGSSNVVAGNLIGTTSAGTQPLSNLDLGVFIDNSPGNVVGPGNVLSANGLAGVEIVAAGSQQNLVAHNNVGEGIGGKIFSSAGQEVLSSNGSEPGIPIYANAQLYGVVVFGASQNTIGVDTQIPGSAGNTISGNVKVGAYISSRDFYGKVYMNPINNAISGNIIRSNGLYGVLFYDAPDNPVRPFTSSSPFLATNQLGGQDINFRIFQTGSAAAISSPSQGSKTKPHPKAAQVTRPARPRVPAVIKSRAKR